MSMCDGNTDDDLVIYDTPLHEPIELAQFRSPKGLVIYHPGEFNGDQYIISDIDFDTYNYR